ncbi:30S ribosome-binding factor RbfA [Fulvivirgaceae bacterium BMA10]|uniref:Ribosome-binding factor A n=2 Tax=Splendidivirga corallicola TaxID=3051826 RepID=A0ABT8KT97_9BACT|nr:30S ribosome-binding factor RbfA [Fulvivirgaceae bacterium BMA10]
MTESKRQQKFNKLLLKDLGEILQRESRNLFGNVFLTVTGVKITPDLSLARIYVSMMLVGEKGEMVDKLNAKKKEIRKLLGNKIGKQVRVVPDLFFMLDDSLEEADRLEDIFKKLDIPPPENQS